MSAMGRLDPAHAGLGSLLEAAVKYAQRGWAVFPVNPGSKTPRTPHGCKEAATDLRIVRRWWERWPNANIGLATGHLSGLIALDFDRKNGKSGLATRSAIHTSFQIDTLTAQTPSGGFHELYQYPGPALRNAIDRQPGLDIRTDGGYILVEPSVVDGRPYRWVNLAPPSPMPPGLCALLCPPVPAVRLKTFRAPNRLQDINRAIRYVNAVPGAVEGHAGDVTTYKLACTLVRGFGLSDHDALALLSWWNRRCEPPWSECELITKITSARRNGREPIGGRWT